MIRLHLAFFTATWLLLGAASVPAHGDITAASLAALLIVALCFHVFAYVLNDVVDLPLDRTQPSRRDDLLVSGTITPRNALVLALVQPLVTVPATTFLGGNLAAHGTLAVGFALMGAYNAWGKRCPFPPLTDLAQGLAWGSLAVYAAQALGGPVTALTWIVAAYATVYIVFINGIHGSFRDLANDLACGARTTAIFFGVRPGAAPGERHVPAAMSVYASTILAALVLLNGLALLRNDFGYDLPTWMALTGVVAALNLWAVGLQPQVLRPRGSASDTAWRVQMYIVLLAMPVAFLAHAGVEIAVILLLLNVLALALFDCTRAVTRWTLTTARSVLGTVHEAERPGRVARAD